MADILLTNETFIKSVTSISDNVAGKYLRPAMREAQEVQLRSILGDTLINKLKDLVDADTIADSENAAYATLLDKCQYLLAYWTIVKLADRVTYKIANAGVVKTPDENVQVVGIEELSDAKFHYQAEADAEAVRLQDYLLNNKTLFPELTEGDCHRIHSNLYSAASCGIGLGGARGKRITYKRYCRTYRRYYK